MSYHENNKSYRGESRGGGSFRGGGGGGFGHRGGGGYGGDRGGNNNSYGGQRYDGGMSHQRSYGGGGGGRGGSSWGGGRGGYGDSGHQQHRGRGGSSSYDRQQGQNQHHGGQYNNNNSHRAWGGEPSSSIAGQRPPRTDLRGDPFSKEADPENDQRIAFKTNFNDQFETRASALRDAALAIVAYRSHVCPHQPDRLTLYDPYFCKGTVADLWKEMLECKVIHENRDFYADVAKSPFPHKYDVLVTNPPFSEDHIPRLFEFLSSQRKPFAVLVPDYVPTKSWYVDWVTKYFHLRAPIRRGECEEIEKGVNTAAATPAAPVAPVAAISGVKKRSWQPPPPQGKQKLPSGASRPIAEDPRVQSVASSIALHPALRMMQQQQQQQGVEESAVDDNDEKKEEEEEQPSAPIVVPAAADILGDEPFYLVPKDWYDFDHRHGVGVGKEKSHFKSLWIVWFGKRTPEVQLATECFASAAATAIQAATGTSQAADTQKSILSESADETTLQTIEKIIADGVSEAKRRNKLSGSKRPREEGEEDGEGDEEENLDGQLPPDSSGGLPMNQLKVVAGLAAMRKGKLIRVAQRKNPMQRQQIKAKQLAKKRKAAMQQGKK